MADIFDSYARGVQLGQQQKQRNQLAELQSLAPQVMGGDLDATSRAYALDPQTAQSYQAEGNRQQQQLLGLAKTLKQFSDNPQMQAGVYRSALPYLKRSFGAEIPDQFDPATVMPIVDQVLAVGQNTPGMGAGGNVQSTYVNRAGQRVAIMRDGTQQILGEADARTQLRDQPGVDPSIIDLRTGQASPVVATQQGARGAYSIDPSLPPEVQAGIRAAEAAGVDYAGQAVGAQVGGAGIAAPRQDPSMQITPYQQAQLANQDRANARADQAAEDARQAREQASQARQIAAQQKAQVAQQAINTRQAQLSDVQRGVARVESALKALDSSRIGTGPAAQLAQRYLPAGQELETAVNAMNNSMLALTRVPGIGAQSDLEARIASMRFPQLDRDEAVNKRTLEDLKSFVQQLSRTARQSDEADRSAIQQAGSGPAGQAPQGGQRTVVRRGTSSGRPVVQYSDGTIEYGN